MHDIKQEEMVRRAKAMMERMASIILWICISIIATGTALAFDLLCFPFLFGIAIKLCMF